MRHSLTVESVFFFGTSAIMDINERKNRIYALMKDPAYVSMKEKELAIIMQVEPEERELFRLCLDELVREGSIRVSKRGRYSLPQKNALEGRFSATGHGYGFVSVDGLEDDFFISEKNTGTALDGDRVRIEPYEVSRRRRSGGAKSREAVVTDIIERATDTFVGTYDATKDLYGFVIPDSARLGRDIFIPGEYSMGAQDGNKVVVKLTSFGDARMNPQGKVIEILGNTGDPGIDILSIVRSYGMDEDFPKEVMREAKSIPQELSPSDLTGREDLRHLDTVTIDGPDSKDLDDAVSLTIEGDRYVLGVHIADVTHYVRENTAIDAEALSRGTSCYPVDRVIPMLPYELCNGICSLNERVDRLALSCFMTINQKGEIEDHDFKLSVINTNHRMTYDDVNRIITFHDEKLMERYSDVADMLIRMHELAQILRNRRIERGSIDFDLPETKIELDDNGRPVSVHPYERNNATRLIEDFMLAANETVAEHFYWMQMPFVYRVHEKPDMDKIRKLATFIRNFGFGIRMKSDDIHPRELQKLLASSADTPEETLISRLALRSMQRARYSVNCDGHFGLALRYYCHFTSPIRRYPDLQIHRIIKEYLCGSLDEERMDHYRRILPEVCKMSSERERDAEEAERESARYKKAEYMRERIGERFTGVISSVTNWGIYVELPNTVEGLVHISKIPGDYYSYNEDTYELVGRSTGTRFALGDRVEVICNMVDMYERTVDFVLA